MGVFSVLCFPEARGSDLDFFRRHSRRRVLPNHHSTRRGRHREPSSRTCTGQGVPGRWLREASRARAVAGKTPGFVRIKGGGKWEVWEVTACRVSRARIRPVTARDCP